MSLVQVKIKKIKSECIRKEHILPLLMSLGNDISRAVILKLDQNHEESLLKHRSLYLMHRASESVAVGAP